MVLLLPLEGLFRMFRLLTFIPDHENLAIGLKRALRRKLAEQSEKTD